MTLSKSMIFYDFYITIPLNRTWSHHFTIGWRHGPEIKYGTCMLFILVWVWIWSSEQHCVKTQCWHGKFMDMKILACFYRLVGAGTGYKSYKCCPFWEANWNDWLKLRWQIYDKSVCFFEGTQELAWLNKCCL